MAEKEPYFSVNPFAVAVAREAFSGCSGEFQASVRNRLMSNRLCVAQILPVREFTRS